MENMKLLLDTNALIDLIACREPYVFDIRKLCIASTFGDVQLWVSTQSFTDAYYVLRKSATEEQVKQALLSVLEFVLPCGTYAADIKAALESEWHDVEDYLIAFSPKHIGADYMITRDADMSSKCPIKAMTAHNFVKYLETEHGLVYDDISI